MKEQSAVIQQDRYIITSRTITYWVICVGMLDYAGQIKNRSLVLFQKKNGANWRAKMNYALTSINGHKLFNWYHVRLTTFVLCLKS